MRNVIKEENAKPFIPEEFGFRIRPYQDKRQSVSGQQHGVPVDKRKEVRDILYILAMEMRHFSEIMLSLLRYAKQVGDVAKNTQNLRRIELYNAIRSVIEGETQRRGKPLFELEIFLKGQGPKELVRKVYPVWDYNQVRMINELDDINDVAPKILCETVLQQIVNRWETHLSNIVRTKYSTDTTLLTDPLELTYEQISSCDGISSVRRLFVDKIVATAMKGGIEDHLRFFKESKGFNINFQEFFPSLNALKEVMFHRDVVVHCDGIASQRHCEKMQGICKAEDVPKQGMKIRTDLRYVFNAWDIVYAAGCLMSYLCCRRLTDTIKAQGLEDEIGGDLVEVSFNALVEQRYAAVQMLIEPLLKCTDKMDIKTKLALRVNLALAYKYSGQQKKYVEIINDSDWDSREENYRAIIAVLRGNFKKAYDLIKKLCKEDPNYLNYVYEWVAYADLRADKNFNEQIAKIKASKSFTPRKGNYPVLEFNAPPEDVGKHLKSLFDSLLRNNGKKADVQKKGSVL